MLSQDLPQLTMELNRLENIRNYAVLSKSQSLKMLHERHLYRVFSADEDPEFDSAYSEEQRVIEAKIRMRQQELQDQELRMLTRQEISSSSRSMLPGEVGYSIGKVDEEIVSSQIPLRQSLRPRQNRSDSRSVTADVKGLARIMLEVALAKATDTLKQVKNLLSKTSEPVLKECLTICASQYESVVEDSILNAIKNVGLDNDEAIAYEDITISNASTCEDTFVEEPNPRKSPFTAGNNAVEHLVAKVDIWEIAPRFSDLLANTSVLFFQDRVKLLHPLDHEGMYAPTRSSCGGTVHLESGLLIEYDWLLMCCGLLKMKMTHF
ncbi:hypothetical protein LOK49_LG15G00081 [Camellia lanceoleosa]|uniref:Uncharacterized protein n=1 Tax=Camellia lanceoleosa TaxID=1840588 RepID=A0ACC0F5S9_9ERIC|nr:hypothetical protein LOK49_LG15G00081 [Camellia lanceoleosa]